VSPDKYFGIYLKIRS